MAECEYHADAKVEAEDALLLGYFDLTEVGKQHPRDKS